MGTVVVQWGADALTTYVLRLTPRGPRQIQTLGNVTWIGPVGVPASLAAIAGVHWISTPRFFIWNGGDFSPVGAASQPQLLAAFGDHYASLIAAKVPEKPAALARNCENAFRAYRAARQGARALAPCRTALARIVAQRGIRYVTPTTPELRRKERADASASIRAILKKATPVTDPP